MRTETKLKDRSTWSKAATFLQAIKNPNALTFGFFELVVPVGGLEPPRPKATDFESVVYTNFTTPALHYKI